MCINVAVYVFTYDIYISVDVLDCNIAEYFYELCRILTSQNTNKYKPTRLISYLLSNFFFSAKSFCSFLLRREKQSG